MCISLLRHSFFDENFQEIYLCVPRNSSNLLRKSIEDYKNVCEDLIVHEGLIGKPQLEKVLSNYAVKFGLKIDLRPKK